MMAVHALIGRGGKVVVVGDSKQLPPTNFFAVQIAAEERATNQAGGTGRVARRRSPSLEPFFANKGENDFFVKKMNETFITETARLLGYERAGRKLAEAISAAITRLVQKGWLQVAAGGLRVAEK